MKRSPIRAVSKKKRAQVAAWRQTRLVVIKRDVTCRAAELAPEVRCWGREEIHHLRRRSQGGTDLPANLALVCEAHHFHVHAHPEWAASVGLLIIRPEAEAS
jgi:hypothetical protein